MSAVSVTKKGQVTIPVTVRKALGIVAGSKVKFTSSGSGARLEVVRGRTPSRVEVGAGMLKYHGAPVALIEADPAKLLTKKRK